MIDEGISHQQRARIEIPRQRFHVEEDRRLLSFIPLLPSFLLCNRLFPFASLTLFGDGPPRVQGRHQMDVKEPRAPNEGCHGAELVDAISLATHGFGQNMRVSISFHLGKTFATFHCVHLVSEASLHAF